MMRRSIIFAALALAVLFAFLKPASIGPVEATPRTWTVDDDGPADFIKIQDAINVAAPYDTILVATGTYHEQLSIMTPNLTIAGENPSNTIIDADGTGWVIYLRANNVTITGFTVQNATNGINMDNANNCTISGNKITSNQEDGVMIKSGSNNTLSNNVVYLNGGHGIQTVFSSSQNRIIDNLLTENKIGMLVSAGRDHFLRNNNMAGNILNFGVLGSSPIEFVHDIDVSNVVDDKPVCYLTDQHNLVIDPSTFPDLGYLALVNSDNITVRNLNLANNYQGILLANTTRSLVEHVTASHSLYGIHLVFSSYNTIGNNIVNPNVEAATGIHLGNSKHNTLAHNDVDSCERGLYLTAYSSENTIVENKILNSQYGISLLVSSSGNLIYHNNFINNTQQATTSATSSSIWDNDYPSGGNYWSDYEDKYPNAEELDGSGIWDTPYVINGADQDNYPLMNPYIMPDLNKDGIVDIHDIAMVGSAYGSTPGDSNWNQTCDVDYSGSVDIADLAVVARNYGKTF